MPCEGSPRSGLFYARVRRSVGLGLWLGEGLDPPSKMKIIEYRIPLPLTVDEVLITLTNPKTR